MDTKEPNPVQEIYWGHDQNRTFWTRGHVDGFVFAAAIGRQTDLRESDVDETAVAHCWGRWVPSTGDFQMRLHVVSGPARGAFAFTVLEPRL